MGILQGITELFPVSSLGHGVLIPALLGWNNLVGSQTKSESFFLAFLVGLHLGTAVALLVYYRRIWGRLTGGLITSVRDRQIKTPMERLAWLIIVGTIPVGLVGLIFEHKLRVQFAKPLSAAIFLIINGFILAGGELLRRRSLSQAAKAKHRHRRGRVDGGFKRLADLPLTRGVAIGSAQILALFAGISRSGVTMVAGISSGLDHEDAAQFSFLLATPVILLAGLYKIPDLLGPNGAGVRMQCLVGSIFAGVAAFLSVKFLVRWFETRNLWPFALYCFALGTLGVIRFG
jgi:undecaprenyl-diphosphatase